MLTAPQCCIQVLLHSSDVAVTPIVCNQAIENTVFPSIRNSKLLPMKPTTAVNVRLPRSSPHLCVSHISLLTSCSQPHRFWR